MNETMSIYAAPAVEKIQEKQPLNQTPDEYFESLNLGIECPIAKRKFQKMWPIFESVCELYDEDPKDIYLRNKKRKGDFVRIRQISMTLFRKRLNNSVYSHAVCAGIFGQKHCTSLWSAKTIENMRDYDKQFRELTDKVW